MWSVKLVVYTRLCLMHVCNLRGTNVCVCVKTIICSGASVMYSEIRLNNDIICKYNIKKGGSVPRTSPGTPSLNFVCAMFKINRVIQINCNAQ